MYIRSLRGVQKCGSLELRVFGNGHYIYFIAHMASSWSEVAACTTPYACHTLPFNALRASGDTFSADRTNVACLAMCTCPTRRLEANKRNIPCVEVHVQCSNETPVCCCKAKACPLVEMYRNGNHWIWKCPLVEMWAHGNVLIWKCAYLEMCSFGMCAL